MKKRLVLLAAAVCLLCCGCGWMDGDYLSVTPHRAQSSGIQTKDVSASNYLQLRTVLENMVDSGMESAVINVAEYRQDLVEEGIANAVNHVKNRYPLGAWAVEEISYEVGTGAGQPAVSVNISYIHGRSEIRKIRNAAGMDQAKRIIVDTLDDCSDRVVVLVSGYEAVDIVQTVEDHMTDNPNLVMEMPKVAVGIYPDAGDSRILEVTFTYETSRETLRLMQQQVQRVFTSASLYVNSDAADDQKYAQLYNFLMERFDYTVKTSITPAYSLLIHGVGDCETFASVYAAMCRQAGLDCHVVSGTKNGQSWYWNIISDGSGYAHVDLLECSQNGQFQRLTDAQMQGYVWDYSAFTQTQTVPEAPTPVETEKAE